MCHFESCSKAFDIAEQCRAHVGDSRISGREMAEFDGMAEIRQTNCKARDEILHCMQHLIFLQVKKQAYKRTHKQEDRS